MQLTALLVLCAAALPVAANPSLKASEDLFIKPFMYGTALLLVAVVFGSVYFVYRMSDEKDPLIYSKFLTVKKKNM